MRSRTAKEVDVKPSQRESHAPSHAPSPKIVSLISLGTGLLGPGTHEAQRESLALSTTAAYKNCHRLPAAFDLAQRQ